MKGPYLRPDGRKHLIVITANGKKTTLSYPKYLMEVKLQRYLSKDETVDHINRDKTDDRIDNLRVIDRKQHAIEDARRLAVQQFVCPYCKAPFELQNEKLRNAIGNGQKGKTGPFCSKRCAGKYGAAVQQGQMLKLPANSVKPTYTYQGKLQSPVLEIVQVDPAKSVNSSR